MSISNLNLQQTLAARLGAQQDQLTQLSEQLSSSKKYDNLTDYTPGDALNLVNLQSAATQRQAYISVIGTVQTRLSAYDTTMTDMESIVSQAKTLASGNPDYNTSTAPNIAIMAQDYLKSVGLDLNQTVNGRYIYAGSRYGTQPVTDLTTLSASSLSSTIYTDGATLPVYDTAYTASGLTASSSGNTLTLSGTVSTPQNVSVTVGSKQYTYAVQTGDTTASIASGLATLVNADYPGTTSSSSGGTATLSVGSGGTVASYAYGLTDSTAYATDSATIDTGYSLSYGVSSNNPAFQQMIAGLRYLEAAGNSTDTATYQANMTQATTLLSSAMTSIESVHTSVANNINILSTEKTSQNTAISSLTDQVSNIEQVDLTQVSIELNLLQTQLQASYSATGTITKMSIVSYL